MAGPSSGEVVIVGGGVAALERLMALRDLAQDAVGVTAVAAEHVAARHEARLDPAPFRPVLRGMLFAGGPDRYLRADAVAAQPLWWPPTKIAGRCLAPYIYERESAAEPGQAPEGFVDLEIPLEAAQADPVGR